MASGLFGILSSLVILLIFTTLTSYGLSNYDGKPSIQDHPFRKNLASIITPRLVGRRSYYTDRLDQSRQSRLAELKLVPVSK